MKAEALSLPGTASNSPRPSARHHIFFLSRAGQKNHPSNHNRRWAYVKYRDLIPAEFFPFNFNLQSAQTASQVRQWLMVEMRTQCLTRRKLARKLMNDNDET